MTENDKKRVAKNKRDTAKAMVIKTVNKRGRVTVFYGCIPLVGRVFEDSIFRIQIHFACAYFFWWKYLLDSSLAHSISSWWINHV